MFTQIKLKLSAKKIAFWSYLAIMAVFTAIAYFSYSFFLKNVYNIITGETAAAQEIADKQASINIRLFNDVIKKIDEKTAASSTRENIKNPFD